jgi:hypothetical protein
VQGTWQVSAPGLIGQPLPLTFQQQYQHVSGAVIENGKRIPITGGKIDGGRINFRVALPGGASEFSGVVDGQRIQGTVAQAGRAISWTAVKTPAPSAAVR